MARRLIYAPRYLRRLDAIAEHVWEDNPAAAERLLERIRIAVERLSSFPSLSRPGRVEGTRELVISGTPYIVPYRMLDDRVEIIGILHSAQRWPSHLS
jgi:plasmid stabilization system protein ParE